MNFSRRHLLLGSAAVIGGFAVWSKAEDFAGEFSPVTPAKAEDLSTLMDPGPMDEKMLGDENAPVTIIEYASMTCGHCGAFHNNTLPDIKKKYIETGKAKLIFREFPGDPRAAAAFMLARCTQDDKYFAMVDVLFKQQGIWVPSPNVKDELFKIAKLGGFTQEGFESCLKNQELFDNVLAVRKTAAEDYGVQATPTFFINGKKYEGNMSTEQMSEVIDGLL